jgi:hypothetical protein
VNFLDLEFLATGSKPYRYALEKYGHGRNQGHFPWGEKDFRNDPLPVLESEVGRGHFPEETGKKIFIPLT